MSSRAGVACALLLAVTTGLAQEGQRREVIPPTPPPSREITGVVLTPDGAPHYNAYVRFVWNDRGYLASVRGRTDAEGRFTLQADEPGRIGALQASVLDYTFRSTAIDPFVAGTQDAMLHLGERRILTLDVRDPDDHVIPEANAFFSWELAGMQAHDFPSSQRKRGVPPWWELPDIPFHVTVQGGRDFVEKRLGPLHSQEIGPKLVVHLEALPRLRGKVTHEGQPVERAEVSFRRLVRNPELDAEPRRDTAWNAYAYTDAQGRFDLPWQVPGEYDVSVWKERIGEGVLGPLVLDPANLPESLEIALTRAPGTVTGKVVLPPDHAPYEIVLSTSRNRGFMHLRPDGSFVLPDLPPGPMRVLVWASGHHEETFSTGRWTHGGDGPSRELAWLPVEPTFDVEVRAGEEIELRLDLTAPPACRLQGRILLDGQAPSPRPRERGKEPRVRLDSQDGLGYVSRTELAPDGTFVLHTNRPGTYVLRIDVPSQGKYGWTLLDRVRLDRGTQPWELDVPTGALQVLPSENDGKVAAFTGNLRWQPRESTRFFALLGEKDEASRIVTYHGVPAGRTELVNKWADVRKVLLVTEIPAGETQTVRSP